MSKPYANPALQNEIVFLNATHEQLYFRTYLKSGGGQKQTHYHTKFCEHFKVIKGELQVEINATTKTLYKNDTATIRPYEVHRFYNASGTDVIFEVEARPALDLKQGFQIMYGLASDGKVNTAGIPRNIFHLAIGVQLLNAYIPSFPLKLQQLGIGLLSSIGQRFGIKKKLIETYCS